MTPTKFKTLVTPNGEFGLLEFDFRDRLFLATSSTPNLFPVTATLEGLKDIWNGTIMTRVDGEKEHKPFDWDEFIGDWKLVVIELKIIE